VLAAGLTLPEKKKLTPETENKKQPEKPAAVANSAPALVPQSNTTPSGKPVITTSKSKRVLTLDKLTEAIENPTESTVIIPTEEKYQGEILLLNEENVLKLWSDYAAKLSPEKKGLKAHFATFTPLLNSEMKLELKVHSDIQKTQFDEIRPVLQQFFSERMGTEVELLVIVDKEEKGGTKPYTPKEKLERLIEKNPAIRKLQEKLGLELDYD
jgi:DNA polymerase-3 subunit gamma/tau